MRKPITTLREFTKRHLVLTEELKAYKLTKRGWRVCDAAHLSLLDYASLSLKATNSTARVVVAASADWQLKALLASEDAPQQFFWVTVIPEATSVPLHDAANFRPDLSRSQIASMFEGFDYFGMIDIAYFPRRTNGPLGHERRFNLPGPLVSFHFHLLVWNCSKSDMERLKMQMNGRYNAVLPNRPAFDFRAVSRKQALGKNLYQLKSPVSSYSAWTPLVDVIDSETGEITKRPSESWTVRKRKMRPGEAADLYNQLWDFNIPSLMLGGGAGLALKKRILRIARGRLSFRYYSRLMMQQYVRQRQGTVRNVKVDP